MGPPACAVRRAPERAPRSAGPYALGLLSTEAVTDLTILEGACLSIIGLAAGAELHLPELNRSRKQVVTLTLAVCFFTWVFCYLALLSTSQYVSLMAGMDRSHILAVASLGATLMMTRSPASAVGGSPQQLGRGRPLPSPAMTGCCSALLRMAWLPRRALQGLPPQPAPTQTPSPAPALARAQIAVFKEVDAKGSFSSLVMAVVVLKDVLVIIAFALNIDIIVVVSCGARRGGSHARMHSSRGWRCADAGRGGRPRWWRRLRLRWRRWETGDAACAGGCTGRGCGPGNSESSRCRR
jgi:hypothetical protein